MTRERIEDIREIVLPFVRNVLLKTNYENLGKSDAEEFTRDFDEILNLAIKALEQEPTRMIDKSNFSQEQYKTDLQCAYDCGKSILDKLRAEITTLQNRCYALTKGTMCAFCRYECEYKPESEGERMTNGEKIQTIIDIDKDCTEVYGKNGMMTFSVPQEWWNTEYKEPNCSEIPTGSIIDWNNCHTSEQLDSIATTKNDSPKYCDRNICLKNEYNNIGCEDCEVTKSQDPTTKNDLAVNLIDREKAKENYESQSFKWCTDCKEYDQEKHCCHRWSKVIRNTVEEMKQEYIEREVLDKIRAEIEQLPTNTRINWDGCLPDIDYPEIEYVDVSKAGLLEIINKYKAESEE